jgi:DNA recombination protein RmuC
VNGVPTLALVGLFVLAGVAVAVLLVALSRFSADLASSRTAAEHSGNAVRQLSDAVEKRIGSFERTIDERIKASQDALGKNIGTMQQQSAESAMLLKSVGENLGRVFEASKKIEKLAGDVTRLEDLLKPPKIRGALGEKFLAEALRQVLPPAAFVLQHAFADGETVDAAITIGDRIVPVDSKFPLENYRKALESPDEDERKAARRQFLRDVKKHAGDIAKKYIRLSEGTYDFALMYIPAEAVYSEIVIDGEDGSAADFALSLRVIPVSPRLLFAYLSTIAQGLKGLEIEKRAHEIVEELARLKRGVAKVEDPFAKLGGHLSNAQKQYDETGKQLSRFTDRLREIAETETEVQPPLPLRALPPE